MVRLLVIDTVRRRDRESKPPNFRKERKGRRLRAFLRNGRPKFTRERPRRTSFPVSVAGWTPLSVHECPGIRRECGWYRGDCRLRPVFKGRAVFYFAFSRRRPGVGPFPMPPGGRFLLPAVRPSGFLGNAQKIPPGSGDPRCLTWGGVPRFIRQAPRPPTDMF